MFGVSMHIATVNPITIEFERVYNIIHYNVRKQNDYRRSKFFESFKIKFHRYIYLLTGRDVSIVRMNIIRCVVV